MSNPSHPFRGWGDQWWNPQGPAGVLHKLNPLRLEYLHDQWGDISHKTVLDVGCGGGLVAEALARKGAKVTAIDDVPETIARAQQHGQQACPRVDVTYHVMDIGNIAQAFPPQTFDHIAVLEVLEHVASPLHVLKDVQSLLKPGGSCVVSTLNRTGVSYLGGIILAERVLGWVPQGAHQWRDFITPEELTTLATYLDLKITDFRGIKFRPQHYIIGGLPWTFTPSLNINYMATLHAASPC